MFNLKREKLTKALFASLFFAVTLFLAGPLSIYFSNIIDLPYTFLEIWYYILGLCLCIIFVLTAIMIRLRASVYQKVLSLVFVLGILFWIQGNLLIWQYGLLDGNEIEWSQYVTNGIIDTSIWMILLIAAFIKSDLVAKFVKKGSTYFILLQLIVLGYNWANAPDEPQYKKYYYSEENQFTFSSNKNVIILLLDTFQSDVFQELINENPKYSELLSGFTYYRNALGGFPTTYPSVPLIMTGQYYDNSKPMQKFLEEKYQSQSIPLALKRNGFDVGLYPMVGQTIYPTSEIASNAVKKGSFSFVIPKTVLNLYQLTMFKYSPHFLKRYFHETEILDPESKNRDLEFLARTESETKIGYKSNTFKFYHLQGTHPPYDLNEKLEIVELVNDREGYKTKAKAAMEITTRFLQTLKNAGVYDQSSIFIIGDHGRGQEVNPASLNLGGKDQVFHYPTVAAGIPLILFKPFGAKGEIKASNAPVSLSDIPNTIMSQMDIRENFPGYSFDKIKQDEQRERRFMLYSWDNQSWLKEYLPPMTEYIVRGFSWDSASWHPTYRKFANGEIQDSTPPVYKYGSEVLFGIKGNSSEYEMWGFSTPEDGFTWTDGNGVSYTLPVSPPSSDLILGINAAPFLTETIREQRINVIINGTKLTQWNVTGEGEVTVKVPKEIVTGSQIKIVLELPDAISPLEAKVSDDSRKLGLLVKSLKISEVQ